MSACDFGSSSPSVWVSKGHGIACPLIAVVVLERDSAGSNDNVTRSLINYVPRNTPGCLPCLFCTRLYSAATRSKNRVLFCDNRNITSGPSSVVPDVSVRLSFREDARGDPMPMVHTFL